MADHTSSTGTTTVDLGPYEFFHGVSTFPLPHREDEPCTHELQPSCSESYDWRTDPVYQLAVGMATGFESAARTSGDGGRAKANRDSHSERMDTVTRTALENSVYETLRARHPAILPSEACSTADNIIAGLTDRLIALQAEKGREQTYSATIDDIIQDVKLALIRSAIALRTACLDVSMANQVGEAMRHSYQKMQKRQAEEERRAKFQAGDWSFYEDPTMSERAVDATKSFVKKVVSVGKAPKAEQWPEGTSRCTPSVLASDLHNGSPFARGFFSRVAAAATESAFVAHAYSHDDLTPKEKLAMYQALQSGLHESMRNVARCDNTDALDYRFETVPPSCRSDSKMYHVGPVRRHMGEEIFGQFTRVADTVEKQYHQTPGNWIIKKLCSTKSELLAPANQTTMAGVNMNEEKSGNISRAAEKEQAKAIDALNEERQKKVSFA